MLENILSFIISIKKIRVQNNGINIIVKFLYIDLTNVKYINKLQKIVYIEV